MRAIRLYLLFAAVLGIWMPAGAAELADLAGKYRLGPEQVGFVVVDVDTGKVLADHQGDRPAVPASVAKLPTAIAALATLGPEHRFQTELALAGSTLVLVGGGDPFLTPEDLRPAFRRLKEMGTRIEHYLYDVSIWPEAQEIDPLQPEASGYNPGVSALALNFNRVRVDWKENGRDATASAVSDTLRLEADAVQLLSAPSVVPPPYRFLSEGPDRWVLTNLPPTGRAYLPVKRPALNAALVIRRLAELEGVSLPMPVEGLRPRNAVPIHVHASMTLAEIARSVLKHSNNMAAEMVGLATAARLQGGRPTGLQDSVFTVDTWLAAQLPEIDWTGFRRANHSGLSPDSRTTPRQMAALVRQGLVRVPTLADILPDREIAEFEEPAKKIEPKKRAGDGGDDKDETAKAGAKKPEAKKGEAAKPAAKKPEPRKLVSVLRYSAKTGTMAYARGLSGLLWAQSGRRLAFAIFVYDDLRRAEFDAALDRRLPEMPAEARAWIRRASVFQRELLKEWAAAY
jgi:D-alanyl-D-alanine carboxypeptidase/D-alanyl-D-alanine-endopeptidase (penicillin-binding protein 4)